MKSHFLYFQAHLSDLQYFQCTFMVFSYFCWPMNCIFLMVKPTWLFFKSISWLIFSWVARFFFSVSISDWYNSNSPIDLFNKPLNNNLTDINRKWPQNNLKLTPNWPLETSWHIYLWFWRISSVWALFNLNSLFSSDNRSTWDRNSSADCWKIAFSFTATFKTYIYTGGSIFYVFKCLLDFPVWKTNFTTVSLPEPCLP